MQSNLIVEQLFKFQLQLKLYHWQTKSFSRHKATDSLMPVLLEFIDKFIESFQGKYGRVKSPLTIKIEKISDSNATEKLLNNFLKFLDVLYEYLSPDEYLLNQIDEIKASINQTKYRFTLK